MGTSFRLRDGQVVQARTPAELREATQLARLCKGTGTAADDDAFRAFVTRRAMDLGTYADSGLGKLTELTEFIPTRVDLVASPASGYPMLMMKATAGQQRRPGRSIPPGVAGKVVKSDSARRYTLTLAYPADKPDVAVALDGHRDFAGKQALENAAWTYLTKSPAVGLWHEDGTEGAGEVVESYIWRGPDWTVTAADGSEQVVKSGDWLLGIRWSEQAWPLVRDGQGRGVSMQGKATRRSPSPGVLAALGKAEAYERMASSVADPALADSYLQVAKGAREQVTGPAGHVAKAEHYEQCARQAADPAARSSYLELAAQERRKAGIQ